MRNEFAELCAEYPTASGGWRDASFTGHPLGTLLSERLPASIRQALPELDSQYEVAGSAGKGDWTHTPWVAVLDRAETDSVQDGIYVVYLLSRGGERLYLTVNQGCTRLKNLSGLVESRHELRRRSDILRRKLSGKTERLGLINMNLNVNKNIWRGKLYQIGAVIGVEYNAKNLPNELDMISDLQEAVRAYNYLLAEGGWLSNDEVEAQAIESGIAFVHAKRYRYHRSIERQPTHSRRAKKILGTRCMGCDLSMEEIYGPIAKGMADVHHLTPLSTIDDGAVVTFNPQTDFAILCPNCHRMIHRLPDSSDLRSLRDIVREGLFDQLRVKNRS